MGTRRGSGPVRAGVRIATEGDAATLGAFIRSAWQEAGDGAPGSSGATDEVIDELADPEAMRTRLTADGRRMLLASLDDEPVGFAATRRLDGGDVELAGIVVRESATGHGFGAQLVAAAVDAARQDGCRRMLVRTEATNARAIGFYRSLGFDPGATSVEVIEGTEVGVVELTRAL